MIGNRLLKIPVSQGEANDFVVRHHRHAGPVVGDKFRIGAVLDGKLVGVVIVGRPVSRVRDDGTTLEITRLVSDGTRNVCSFLYGSACKAAFALGYARVGTYTLASEIGGSLRAAGFSIVAETKGRSWNCPSRPRIDKHPMENKTLWERIA